MRPRPTRRRPDAAGDRRVPHPDVDVDHVLDDVVAELAPEPGVLLALELHHGPDAQLGIKTFHRDGLVDDVAVGRIGGDRRDMGDVIGAPEPVVGDEAHGQRLSRRRRGHVPDPHEILVGFPVEKVVIRRVQQVVDEVGRGDAVELVAVGVLRPALDLLHDERVPEHVPGRGRQRQGQDKNDSKQDFLLHIFLLRNK